LERDARRLEFLDGLRALAALVVLVHHAQLEVWAESVSPLNYFGRMAVDVFIVLSGFCLMLPALRAGGRLRDGTLGFFARRARRILPPYYGALALSLLLIWAFIGEKTGAHWDASLPVTRNGVVANLILLQNIVHRYEINHAFWSIATEWQIYFLFPLLLLSWRRLGPAVTASLALAASLAVVVLLHGSEVTYHFVGLFAVGMLGATLAFSETRVPWQALAAGLWLAVAGLMAFGWTRHITSPRGAFCDTVVGLAAMTLVVAAARRPNGWLHQALAARPLARIGLFSYSLYLVHAPLVHLVWQYALRPLHLGPRATFSLLVAAGGPAIVGAAWLFFLVLERPFLRAAAPSPRLAVNR
jgi:peptidoglycan/LPS O-acetylase OafA/YrhL